MAIVYLAFMFGPLLGTAAGYLVGGITGATAGFVIPMGPLCRGVAFRGALTMHDDRYGRRGYTGARGSQRAQHAPGCPTGSLRRGGSAFRQTEARRG
jgi:hypothetical protein